MNGHAFAAVNGPGAERGKPGSLRLDLGRQALRQTNGAYLGFRQCDLPQARGVGAALVLPYAEGSPETCLAAPPRSKSSRNVGRGRPALFCSSTVKPDGTSTGKLDVGRAGRPSFSASRAANITPIRTFLLDLPCIARHLGALASRI